MCVSPKMPAPTPPPQEAKAADPMQARRTNRKSPMAAAGGSLLTGPSGVAQGTTNLGGSTLLGG